MSKQSTVLGYLQLLAVLLFLCGAVLAARLMRTSYEAPKSAAGEELVFFVEAVEREAGPYQVVFETTGTVEVRAEVNVVPQISGRVVSLDPGFFDGGQFAADETVFQIDPRDFELEIDRLEADVAQARTALKLEEAEAEAAAEEWRQVKGDRAVPDLVARRPQIEEAMAGAKAATARLATAKLALERSSYRFPKPGRVLQSGVQVGQFLVAGQSYGRVFFLDSLEVRASLNDQELAWISESKDVGVEVRARYLGEERTFAARVDRGAVALDGQTRFATVRFAFTKPPQNLLPGVFAEIFVNGPQLEDVTVVPASALQADGGLWIVDGDERLQPVEPEIIYREAERIAVGNLPDKSRVVVSRLAEALPGAKARIVEPQVAE